MALTDGEKLRRLGSGQAIVDLCTADGSSADDFAAWWKE